MIFRKTIPFMRGRRRLVCEALEERIVLDAAVDQGASDDSQNDTSDGDTPDDTQAIPGAQSSEGADQPTDPVEQVASDDLNVVLISSALDQVNPSSRQQRTERWWWSTMHRVRTLTGL
jgi:hypothetical protein